ncbi:MAG: ATP-binding protein [Eubacteriales bacterium]|nr:ATP-binding protein [Eubacteriales bacterium]
MLANFDRYDLIIQARKSKKFRELDDKVRVMAFELGKKNPAINKAEYQKLKMLRDQQLTDFVNSMEPTVPVKPFDRTVYQKIDPKTTQKIDLYLSKFPNNKFKNLVITGPTGTGKTYCASLIQHELTRKGFNVQMTSTFNLVKRMTDYLFGQDANVPSDFFNSDLLIIDDLGAEPSIKNSDEMLHTVINERYSNNLPFIITTNLSKDQVSARYDDRILGRIYDKARSAILIFNGKDLRIE